MPQLFVLREKSTSDKEAIFAAKSLTSNQSQFEAKLQHCRQNHAADVDKGVASDVGKELVLPVNFRCLHV